MWNNHYFAYHQHFAAPYYQIWPGVAYQHYLTPNQPVLEAAPPLIPSGKKQQRHPSKNKKPNPEPQLTQTRLRQRKKPSKSGHKRMQVTASQAQRNHGEVLKRKQKQYRNIPSNICRHFILYIYNHPSPYRLLLAEPQSERASELRECIREIQAHIQGSQAYVRPRLIEDLCRGGLIGERLSLVFRMMFNRFLKEELRMIVACLGKIGKKEKIAYFRVARRYIRGLGFE